jgi:NADPH2 dehydrogenase
MTISSTPELFQPIRVGTADLQHRVVMAPMARFRADEQHVHGPLALEYYKQRTSVPGTLVITEGTIIAAQAGGYRNVPGIWSNEQISGWSKVRRPVPFPLNVTDALTYLRIPSQPLSLPHTFHLLLHGRS